LQSERPGAARATAEFRAASGRKADMHAPSGLRQLEVEWTLAS